MRKYVSKLLLEIFLSVLATVSSSYVTYHYILIEKAPGAAANATLDPREAVSFEVPTAPTQAEAVLAKGPPGGSGAVGPVASADVRIVEQRNDERAGLSSSAGQAEPTNGPAGLRAGPRDSSSKISANVAPKRRLVTISQRKPSRAAREQSLSRSVNPSVDVVRPLEIELEDPPLSTEMKDSHLAGTIWKPISRTALRLLHSLSLASGGQEPLTSFSLDGIFNGSRVGPFME
ncbi:MAG: hypothetical protein E8A46_26525 [Bradyrhizobium sp.]|jgi:hypothetical protein|uniref:hypothetical protein n=1 Tax=Bradyrhizobium sp. TaxID=376 RepID=UPI0011FCF41F|nr:hypothetical protein [Bradyrhizobium sp.]THD46513.1 MAG: hypothetical protein E8A46_26525 [Bradyrhizobium sp.]